MLVCIIIAVFWVELSHLTGFYFLRTNVLFSESLGTFRGLTAVGSESIETAPTLRKRSRRTMTPLVRSTDDVTLYHVPEYYISDVAVGVHH